MKTIRIFVTAIFATTVISCGTPKAAVSYENNSDSDEVVNVGYGQMTRSEMTTTSSVISSENTPQISYKNMTEYLQGKVAGVQITDNGDSEPTIVIRGTGTINSGTTPLYILDGIEISTINQIDPNMVYSVEVLRDASAAIYGAKGANGVLLITTKARHDLDEQERIQKMEARQARKASRK